MNSLRTFVIVALAAGLLACRGPESRPDAERNQVPAQQQPTPASAAERARAHTDLGANYFQIGRLAVALQELNEALKADPNFAPAHNALGLVHMELKEDAKARASFERALRIDPKDSDANNNFGLFLCNRGQEKESVRYFLRALENPLYATPGDSYVNAGICSRRAGDIPSAQLYLERAVEFQSNDARALVNLAQLHFDRRQLNLARTYMTRYMQSVKTADAQSLWLGVQIEQALGDRAAVMSYGAQLRARFPDAPQTRQFNEGRYE